MLRTSLDSHPNVRCYREIFRSRERAGAGRGVLGLTTRARTLLVNKPDEFLDSYLTASLPSGVKAVGFKLAYGHAREPEWHAVWQWLVDRQIHVIELRRRDLLAGLLSQARARETGRFVQNSSRHVTPAERGMWLSPELCERYLRNSLRRRAEADATLGNTPRIVVEYEDLLDMWQQETTRIQSFLGVPQLSIGPRTVRQSSRAPADAILNMPELEAHFSGTEYEQFFELTPRGQK